MIQQATWEEEIQFNEVCSQKFDLVDKLKKIEQKMKAIKDEIRLIDAYKEYLKRYKEYKEILSKKIFGRKKYEKDNTDLVERYREIYNKIVELHPDKTIPARTTLEKKLVKLECEYNEIYKQYRNNEILFRALMKKGYSGNKKSKPLNGTCPELELTLF